MNRDKPSSFSLKQLLPQNRRALFGTLALTLLAFVVGLWLAGGGEAPPGGSGEHNHTAETAAAPTVWTCSMHPQIKLPKPGKCPICFMDLIPLETGAGEDLGPRQLRMSATARQLARIQTTAVRRSFAEADVRMVGRIGYDETRVAYITAWVPGRLDRLYADFTGIAVRKGDHMVSMYSPELLAAQEEMIQAAAAGKALSGTRSTILTKTAELTLVATREKLRLLGLTDGQIADIQETGRTSDHLTIYAPIGGVVVHKDAREGMYVQTGTRIYTIADLSRLWVLFEAYESDLPWLRYGQHVHFTSTSFPGEGFTAVISFIDPVVDPQTRTIQVRAIVQNEEGRLKPGMFVSGTVHSQVDGSGRIVDENLAGKWISPMHPEIVKDGPGVCDVCGMDLVPADSFGYVKEKSALRDAPLLIPASAPLITGRRAVVYVELPDQERPLFEGREVELGPRAGDFYVVRSGLAEGELVVTNGAFKIDAELQIQAKPSMMSPEGGAPAPGHQHGKPSNAGPDTPAEDPAHDHTAAEQDGQDKLSAAAREALTPIYEAYFDVQEALAADDAGDAQNSGSVLESVTEHVDMTVFSGASHMLWMDHSTEVKRSAAIVAAATEIESARAGFVDLSRAIIALHNAFGHADGREYFLTHCPMASGGDGAHWLQTADVVSNPFYGASMLRCGSIQDAWPQTSAQEK